MLVTVRKKAILEAVDTGAAAAGDVAANGIGAVVEDVVAWEVGTTGGGSAMTRKEEAATKMRVGSTEKATLPQGSLQETLLVILRLIGRSEAP
jgi:hypothetical protein